MVNLVDIQLLYRIIGTEMSSELPHASQSVPPEVAAQAVVLEDLDAAFESFLQAYTGIPEDNISNHIASVQAAFPDLFARSGINDLQLLRYNIRQHPRYAYLLGQLRTVSSFNPPALLLIGTTFGQDLRYLLQDGIPASKLYACFLRPELFEVSTRLFCDAETFPATHAIRAEVIPGESSSPLYETAGSWTAINSNNYLSRFDLDTQERIAHTMLSLLRQEEGSILSGSVLGLEHDTILSPVDIPGSPYRHTATTLRHMWERVQQQSGLNLYVEIQTDETSISASTTTTIPRRIFFFLEIQPNSQQSEWRVFG